MIKQFAASALILASVVTGAQARGHQQAPYHTWYVLDFGSGTCHLSPGVSPDDVDRAWRATDPAPPTIDIKRDDDGNIKIVMIAHSDERSIMLFTTTMETCETIRKAGIADGVVIDHSELR